MAELGIFAGDDCVELVEGLYRRKLPRPADVHAVIEVAMSALISDRTRKLEAYAAASYRIALRGDTIAFSAFPDVGFTVDELLG